MGNLSLHPGVWTGSLGLGFAGAFAVLGAPDKETLLIAAGWAAIVAAVMLAVWGLKHKESHWLALLPGWISRNVWWRFRAHPPVGADFTLIIPPTQIEPEDATKIAPAPRPTFVAPTESDDLGYAYPKAVLKAEVPKPRGTISATGGRHVSVSVLMCITNDHSKPLADCSVWLAEISENGVKTAIGKSVRVGGGNTFTVQPHTATNFHIVSRDMTDEITPAPFMLKLVKRELLLKESSQYVARLELRSRYRHPTIVHLQIDTGVGLDVEVKLLKQALEVNSNEAG